MTQMTAMFIMFVLYGVLPAAGLYLGYRGIKKMTAPKMLEYKAMPQLGLLLVRFSLSSLLLEN